MTTWFHTDADLAGAATFDEPEIALATRFNVPDGTYLFRWRSGSAPPSNTPQIRIWNEASGLVAGPLDFTTAISANAWHETTGVALTAGTYRVAVNTTRYLARTGFYSGGSVVRDGVTGISGMFGASPTSAPGTSSTATYFLDIGVPDDPDPEPEPEPALEAVADDPSAGAVLHLARVMDEVALALGVITGLKSVFAYPPPSIVPPAAYVTYPARMVYHQTYQRGTADIEGLPIVLVVGDPTKKRVRDKIAQWSAPDGTGSVMAALEAWDWTSCDDLTVSAAEFDVETIAGIEYMAVIFTATAVGPGRE
jgi:hypothetical protein